MELPLPTLALRALLIPILVAPLLAATHAGPPQEDPPADEKEAPTWEFENAEARQAYDDGVASFVAGSFTEAGKSFRDARKGSSGDTRDHVEDYEKACKGGSKLSRIEKSVAKEDWRRAYAAFVKLEESHGETPLSLHLEPLRETIEGALFFPLANFEADAPDPESAVASRRPDSCALEIDEDLVREGKRSLRWNSGGGPGGAMGNMIFGMVPIAAFDGSLTSEYPIIDLWLHSSDDNFGKFSLYFGVEEGGPGQTMAAGNVLQTRAFIHHITLSKKGWHHVRVNLLKELPKNTNVSWDEVTGVGLLTVPPSHPKTIHIDGVRLERP